MRAFRERFLWPTLVSLAIGLAYCNHFNNDFQFDDGHAVVDNPAIRHLGNIPRMFWDGRMLTPLMVNQAYRPLQAVTLTLDYAISGGLNPFFFHLSTFLIFLAQIFAVAKLFNKITGSLRQAWLGAALYGLHPVAAQTVNYVCQRAEVYVALFLTLAMWAYISRRIRLAIGCFVLACLSKQNGIVFPGLVIAYEYFLGKREYRRVIPFAATAAIMATVIVLATPSGSDPGGHSRLGYWSTQPYVLMTYLKAFVWPSDLVGDSDMIEFSSPAHPKALLGYLGLMLVALAIGVGSKRIGFGLSWFIITQSPTLLIPLSDVTNDHRMYVPFIGLCLIVADLARTARRQWLIVLLLPILAFATFQRNKIWFSHENFWTEVCEKCPANGRGRMNLAIAQLEQGRNAEALRNLLIAQNLLPENYTEIYENLGLVYSALGDKNRAEAFFRKAIEVDHGSTPLITYGEWLDTENRIIEAAGILYRARKLNPLDRSSSYRLQSIFGRAAARARREKTCEAYTDVTTLYYLAENYPMALRAARIATDLDPSNANAHSNRAACCLALGLWQEAYDEASLALKLDPSSESAMVNRNKAASHL